MLFLTDFHENLEGHGCLESMLKEKDYFSHATLKATSCSVVHIWIYLDNLRRKLCSFTLFTSS
jgi:hypothetical protein